MLWRLIANDITGSFQVLAVSKGAWTLGCFDRHSGTASFILNFGPKNAVDVRFRYGKMAVVNPTNKWSGLTSTDAQCAWVLSKFNTDRPEWRSEKLPWQK